MDNKVFLDLTKVEEKTAATNICRAQVMNDIIELLQTKYDGVRRCGATSFTFPIAIGTVDGFTVDINAIVSVKIPKHYDTIYKNSLREDTPAYDIVREVYEWETDPKTEKKLEKEAKCLEIAKESRVESQGFEYNFDEVDY